MSNQGRDKSSPVLSSYKVIFNNNQFCTLLAFSLLQAKIEAAKTKGTTAALSGIREARCVITYKQLKEQTQCTQ